MERDLATLLKDAAPKPQQPPAPEAARRRASRIRAVRHAIGGVATLAVVAVSVLVGPQLLTPRVDTILAPGPGHVTVSVFLMDEATVTDQTAIEEELRSEPAVITYRYQSKSQTYEQFAEQYADDPVLLDSVSPEELPASYQVVVDNQEAARDLMTRLGDMRGVDHAAIIDP